MCNFLLVYKNLYRNELGGNENIILNFNNLEENVSSIVIGAYYDWFRICSLDFLQIDSNFIGSPSKDINKISRSKSEKSSFKVTCSNYGKFNTIIYGKFV